MDKYTVDLDQVLNDFEYSELTDQQSKNASEKPQGTTNFQPPPVTKHSINNVFHSLNEYLNSEISTNGDKVVLERQDLGYDQQNLGKIDNNIVNNVKESYSKINEASYSVTSGLEENENKFENFSPNSENLGQNERLLKLKNEPQVVDVLEKAEDNSEHDTDSLQNMQLDLLQEVTENLHHLVEDTGKIQQSLESKNPSSSNKRNLDEVHQDIYIESQSLKKSNEDLYKTDIKNFSLLDMENIESELIPGLNCTENNIKSEFQNVNNDKECDKNIDNKADNKLNNERISFGETESFIDVDEYKTGGITDSDASDSKTNEDKDMLFKKTESANEKSDNINMFKNMENFVIEPSESTYALEQDNLQNDKSIGITEAPLVDSDVVEYSENTLKMESTKEQLVETDNEVRENTSHTNEHDGKEITQINKHVNPSSEELSADNDSNTKRDSFSIENVAEEQKVVVGFCTDIDIDEKELNKMLEDLEIEEGSDLENNLAREDDLKKIESSLMKDQEDKIEEINVNMGVDSLISDDSLGESKHNVQQNDDGKIVSRSLNSEAKIGFNEEIALEKQRYIEDSEKQLEKSRENIQTQLIECLEVEKSSKKHTSKNIGKFEDNKNESTEIFQEQSNTTEEARRTAETPDKQSVHQVTVQDVDKTQTKMLQKQQSQDSLVRPQDLPLNNDLKEEIVTRKIDLIGMKQFKKSKDNDDCKVL